MIELKYGRAKKLLKKREFNNIFFPFFFRLGSILCNFLIVPLLINQLSKVDYGILITIISISTWFSFVDFGLANGLKNKISKSLVSGKQEEVRKYVSSAYFALFKVVLILSCLLIVSSYFVNWNDLINGPVLLNSTVNKLFLYGLLLFFLKLLIELINPILLAYHLASISAFISFISQLGILAVSYLFKMSGSRSLLNYGLLFFWLPMLVLMLSSVFYYLSFFRSIKPSVIYFDKSFEKRLFHLGGKFFVIQIAALIIFTTDNIIVGRIFGYDEVSNYNIAFRYFNIPLFVLTIILTPYWPIFAEHFAIKNSVAIKRITYNLIAVWGLIFFLTVGMLFVAPTAYFIWVGDKVYIPFVLNLGMALFCIISGWNSIFATFINSTSKLKVQFYSAIITGTLNIPLSIFLAKYTNLGSAGVIFGTCACLLVGSFWAPVQYLKLVNNNARGIWNK